MNCFRCVSFWDYLSTMCSEGVIMTGLCPFSCVVRRALSVNIFCLSETTHRIMTKLNRKVVWSHTKAAQTVPTGCNHMSRGHMFCKFKILFFFKRQCVELSYRHILKLPPPLGSQVYIEDYIYMFKVRPV